MTSPQRLNEINPSPNIHRPPREIAQVKALTSKQVGVAGVIIVDLVLAQIAFALANVSVLGTKPFQFLTQWGNNLVSKAENAYRNGFAIVDAQLGNPAGTTTTGTLNDVYTAAAAVTSTAGTANANAGTALENAIDAQSLANDVISAGSNVIIDPSFENVRYQTPGSQFSLNYSHTGSRSLRLVGRKVGGASYTLLSGGMTPNTLKVSPGDVFFASVWVRGVPTNTQTSGGAGALRMLFEPLGPTGGALTTSSLSYTASTAINNGWVELSGYVIMPSTAAKLRVSLQLSTDVNDDEIYHWDDVTLREVTLASTANATANVAAANADTALVGVTAVDDLTQDVIASGSNILVNPGFEKGLFAQGGGTYSTAQARTGSRSLKMTAAGIGTKTYTFMSDDSGRTTFIPVTPADVFYAEVFVRGDAGNSQTSGGVDGIQMVFEPFNGLTALTPSYIALTARQSLNTQWTKLAGYVTMPAGATRMKISLQLTSAVNGGEAYFWDDALVREVTLASTANATAGSAYANADTALVNAQVATDLGTETASAGSNIVKNSSFEKGLFAQGAATFSTEQKRTGNRSLRMAGTGSSTRKYILNSDDSTTNWTPASPGDVFAVEFWVYGKSTNTQTSGGSGGIRFTFEPYTAAGVNLPDSYVGYTASTALNGVWTKVAAYLTMPDNTARVRMTLQLTGAVANNEIYYFDDVSAREVTLASAANATAGTATANANTALQNAQDANDFAGDIVSAGSNLVKNSDFERGISTQPLVATFSTDYAYSGSKSLKFVAGSSIKTYYLLFDGLSPRTLPVSEGDVFYCEMQVYGGGFGGPVTDGLRILFEPTTKTGANLPDCYIGVTVSSALNGSWTKVAAYVTMPAGAVKTSVAIQFRDTVTSGQAYIDQVIIREVTLAKAAQTATDETVKSVSQAIVSDTSSETAPSSVKTNLKSFFAKLHDGFYAQPNNTTSSKLGSDLWLSAYAARARADLGVENAGTAQTAAEGAQNTVDLRSRDFTNLAGGSDFEGAKQPWTLGTGWTIATDQQYAGTQSLKHSGSSAGTSTLAGTFACLPGEQFYIELYARKDGTFNGTTNDKIRLINQSGTEIGFVGFGSAAIASTFVWTQLSTTVTIPAATNSFTVTAVSNSTSGSVWLDNIVIRRVATSNVIATLPQSKITDLPADIAVGKGAATDVASTVNAFSDAVNGNTTTGNTPATVKTNMQLAFARLFDGLSGNALGTSTAKASTDLHSAGKAARDRADLGVTTIDLRARDFSNLVAGADFEGTTQPFTLGTGWSIATDQFNNGAKSAKHVAGGGTLTSSAVAAVVPDESFLIDFWVRRDSSYNGDTNSYFSLYDPASATFFSLTYLDSTSLAVYDTWVNIRRTVTIPAGVTSMRVIVQANHGAGNLWIDDIVVRRVVTEETLEILNKDKVDGLPQDLSTTRSFFSEPRWLPSWVGGLSDDVSIPTTSVSAAGSGLLNRLYMIPVTVTQNRVYTAVKFGVSFTSVTVTNFYAGLYSVDQSDGTATLVKDLGDIKAQLNNAVIQQTITIPDGGVSVQAGELYYVALLMNGGTAMNLAYATTAMMPNFMTQGRWPKFLCGYYNAGSPTSLSSVSSVAHSSLTALPSTVLWAALGTPSPIVVPAKLQYSDGFTRADTTSLGTAWITRYGNGLAVSSGAAAATAAAGTSINTFTSKLNYTDQSVSAKFTRKDNVSAGGMLLSLRGNGNGNFVYLRIYQSKSGLLNQVVTTARIYTASSYSTPGSLFTGGTVRDSQNYSVNDGVIMPKTETWTFTAVGTTYTGYRNGVSVCSWTDSGGAFAIASTSKEVGAGAIYNSAVSLVDDWVANDL